MDKSLSLLGDNVRIILRERRLSERALAKKMEMSPSQLNKNLNGVMPELRLVSKIADALGVSPAELLMSEEERRDRGHGLAECIRRSSAAAMKVAEKQEPYGR